MLRYLFDLSFSVLALLLCASLSSTAALEASTPHERSFTVLVTVAPHKHFVEKIAGDTLKVMLMVPTGYSSHTFEPSPKQMLYASKADIWFRLGESFEKKAITALQSHNQHINSIDMRNGLSLVGSQCHHTHDHSHNRTHLHEHAQDLHYWLSPRLAKQQAITIAAALSTQYPEHSERYAQALEKLLGELTALDQDIAAILEKPHNPYILVSHPAYAYFCRDYHLKQLSIEFEGRDPTPYQLTLLLNQAKNYSIRKIFVQKQYSNKGAILVGKKIDAEVITLEPYDENYFTSMRQIAQNFANNP